ncbi:MAG TPA: hypothetical protein VHA52_06075, partial [Candidatus Babeliaceae bacterium]|nr:hypothetical protein [Candidatus Babeliaceae bacterium]
ICEYFSKHNLSPKPKKAKKEKYLSPKYVIVFDDMSNELKSPSVVKLLKESRHFLCKVVIGSQYLHDLRPESTKQIDYWLIFKGQPKAKLEVIHTQAEIPIPFESFWEVYKLATEVSENDTHPFLFIDVRKGQFRKNFNKLILLPENAQEE